MTDESDRCKYHVKCRADHARDDMLCGFHHVKNWDWCQWHREYERLARLEKARSKTEEKAHIAENDETITKET